MFVRLRRSFLLSFCLAVDFLLLVVDCGLWVVCGGGCGLWIVRRWLLVGGCGCWWLWLLVCDCGLFFFEFCTCLLVFSNMFVGFGVVPIGAASFGAIFPSGRSPEGSMAVKIVPVGFVVPVGTAAVGAHPRRGRPHRRLSPFGPIPVGAHLRRGRPRRDRPRRAVGTVPVGTVPVGSVPVGNVRVGADEWNSYASTRMPKLPLPVCAS